MKKTPAGCKRNLREACFSPFSKCKRKQILPAAKLPPERFSYNWLTMARDTNVAGPSSIGKSIGLFAISSKRTTIGQYPITQPNTFSRLLCRRDRAKLTTTRHKGETFICISCTMPTTKLTRGDSRHKARSFAARTLSSGNNSTLTNFKSPVRLFLPSVFIGPGQP